MFSFDNNGLTVNNTVDIIVKNTNDANEVLSEGLLTLAELVGKKKNYEQWQGATYAERRTRKE